MNRIAALWADTCISLVAGLVLATCAVPAHAAELEEIVVTATRRQESTQDIPISVTAFSAESIESLGFAQSFDIASQVPNLKFMGETASTIPFIFLRGIGNTSFFANSINPVALYVDSVYLGQNITQGFQLFDLERVEVLRGPQGTLFGRNTTAGLVHFLTRKPSVDDGLNARAEITGGDFGQFDVEGAVGFPLGDRAAARISAIQQMGSGMYEVENPFRDVDKTGDVDMRSVRAQLLWSPTDDVEVLIRGHWGEDNSELNALKPGYIVSPFGVPNCPPGAVSGALNNGCSDPFGIGLTVDPDFEDVQFTFDPFQELEGGGVSGEINWIIGDYTVTSLTAWNTADMTRLEDDDANILAILSDTFLADAEFFSQELRLTSNLDGPFNWILGAYYYTDELDSALHFNNVDLGPPPGTGIPVPVGVAQNIFQETESWSVFGEVTYRILERLTARAGLRLTEDQRSVDIDSFFMNALLLPRELPISRSVARNALLFPLILPASLKDDWFEWSGRFALDYEFAEHQMVYFSAARGFKGGEFNGGALLDPSEATIADPEFMDSYELGYKGTLLDRSLQLNVTGFFMQYDDQQVLISGATPFGLLPSLQNAASSDIRGVEVEMQWQPDDNWFLLLGGAHLDAEFDRFLDPALGVDREGNRLAHAPEWTVNGIVRYTQPIGGGTGSAQVDWSWNDDQFFTVENLPSLREGDYAVVNGRVSYRFWNDRVELALFVKNIFDEGYKATGFDTASAGFGAHVYVMSRPRTFGGQLILNYD
ncbi:MAG: TonB-dependent receptor [Gammaproteobacteria bacterium]|nr:TonB-dependent receptor [Gammaproteobacteria bacterium]